MTRWRSSHPPDIPPPLSVGQRDRLVALLDSAPSEATLCDYGARTNIASRGDDFVLSMGRLYASAHCYTSAWRRTRPPTTLKPENPDIFRWRIHPALLGYVREVAVYGVGPMASKPPLRYEKQPHSSVRGIPLARLKTCGGLAKGRIVLFTNDCESTIGPLM